MNVNRKPFLTPGEALEFHKDVLVVDTKMPANHGLFYNDNMREAMKNWVEDGRLSRSEIQAKLY